MGTKYCLDNIYRNLLIINTSLSTAKLNIKAIEECMSNCFKTLNEYIERENENGY